MTTLDTSTNKTNCAHLDADEFSSAKLFNFIFIMIVSLFGITGNILVVFVFSKQKKRTSATTFLKMLAIFDTLLIISVNIFSHRYVYPIAFPSEVVDHIFAGKFTIGILPIGYTCQTLSTWTVVAVTLDRYIHVCHPLRATRWCKIRTAYKITAVITFISIIYNVPRFFEYYKILELAEEAIDKCTGYFKTPEGTLGYDKTYNYLYAFGMYMTVMYAVPLGSLIFFNGSLIRKLRTMVKPGKSGEVKRLRGSDKILPPIIGVVTLFVICQIPDMVLQILWRINSHVAPTFSIFAYDFIIINSSLNFVIYVVAAKGFRKSLKKHIFGCIMTNATADPSSLASDTTGSVRHKIRQLLKDSSYKTNVPVLSSSDVVSSMDLSVEQIRQPHWKQIHRDPIESDLTDTSVGPDSRHEPSTASSDVWIGGGLSVSSLRIHLDDPYTITKDPLHGKLSNASQTAQSQGATL